MESIPERNTLKTLGRAYPVVALALCSLLLLAGFAASALAAPVAATSGFNCEDFATQGEAQEYLEPGDPYGLDADSDGIACEDLPAGGGGGGGGGSAQPAPPRKPAKLEGSTARDAAQAAVRRLKRRSKTIDEISATGCRRASRERFDCLYGAYGQTAKRATSCRLRVTIRGSGFVATSVKLRVACKSRPILSIARAKAAMLTELQFLAGRPVGLMAIERRSFGRFIGYAEWSTQDEPAEECAVDLAATLSSTGDFSISSQNLLCRVAGALPSKRVLFQQYIGIEPEAEIEPPDITIGSGALGGTFSTTGLNAWRGWGTSWATVTGVVHFRGCLPTCVQGKLFNLPTTVVLDRVGSSCGQDRYSRIRILPKGGPYRVIGPYGVDCDGSLD